MISSINKTPISWFWWCLLAVWAINLTSIHALSDWSLLGDFIISAVTCSKPKVSCILSCFFLINYTHILVSRCTHTDIILSANSLFDTNTTIRLKCSSISGCIIRAHHFRVKTRLWLKRFQISKHFPCRTTVVLNKNSVVVWRTYSTGGLNIPNHLISRTNNIHALGNIHFRTLEIRLRATSIYFPWIKSHRVMSLLLLLRLLRHATRIRLALSQRLPLLVISYLSSDFLSRIITQIITCFNQFWGCILKRVRLGSLWWISLIRSRS